MKNLTRWIKNHPIVAFFTITYAISWGLGFSYHAAQIQEKLWAYPVAVFATCGPAMAGIFITALSDPQPRQRSRRTFWCAFCVTWVVVTVVWLAFLKFINGIQPTAGRVIFSLFIVLPVVFVISMAYSHISSMKRYLSSLIRLRGVGSWALLALVFDPALVLVLIPVNQLLGRPPITAYPLPRFELALIGLIAVRFAYQFLFFNAAGEEVGWRGFAFPRLQARTSPLVASLIVGIFWAPWHFFLWQSEGAPVDTMSFWLNNGLAILISSLITGWFYNRSRGSILVAGVIHAAGNTTARVLPIMEWFGYGYIILLGGVALGMILVDRMWKKLPQDHPAVIITPATA